MKTPTIFLSSVLLALPVLAPSASAQATADGNGCVLRGGETASPSAKCEGGPLKPGDPRLGSGPMPRTLDREGARGHSFQVGGSTVTISGSIRVEGVYSR
ncbi:hypothetical protein ACUSIJ_19785 [Pseudochelatococcus sp. B33]